MPNITASELRDALERAGLPTNNYKEMKAQAPFARRAIQNTVFGEDTQTPQMTQEYKDKIAKIAEVDKRLAGLYSDPSSNLYIERASTREGVLGDSEQIGYKTAQKILDKIAQRQKDLESKSSEALNFFKELTAANKPEAGTDGSGDIDFETLLSGYNEGDSESDLDKLLREFSQQN